jgi:hypothetical protein
MFCGTVTINMSMEIQTSYIGISHGVTLSHAARHVRKTGPEPGHIRDIINKVQIIVLHDWNIAKAKLYMAFFIDR